MKEIAEFEEKIGFKFNDIKILKQAFTHRSYLNENKGLKIDHNERLEFLGDAVLELVITDYLYEKYPEKNEGDLTSIRSALVNAQTCASVAKNLEVNDYLLLSRGETKDIGRARQYILANALEAIIGAIYIDLGYEKSCDCGSGLNDRLSVYATTGRSRRSRSVHPGTGCVTQHRA